MKEVMTFIIGDLKDETIPKILNDLDKPKFIHTFLDDRTRSFKYKRLQRHTRDFSQLGYEYYSIIWLYFRL